jgi:hypothetical protein
VLKVIDVDDTLNAVLTSSDVTNIGGNVCYLHNTGEVDLRITGAAVPAQDVWLKPGQRWEVTAVDTLEVSTVFDGVIGELDVEVEPAQTGDYFLVGGPYTPTSYVGQPCSAVPTSILLLITQSKPPPHTSHDGVVIADTTDPDVLGVRAYLATSWGIVRQYEEGNLTIGDVG